MDITAEHIAAINQAHQAFATIIQQEKCATCSCFHTDILATIYHTTQELCSRCDDQKLHALAQDFADWLEKAQHTPLHQ